MAYYSCNYRIPVTIPEGEYTVSLNGVTLFNGNVKSIDGSNVTIDISPICRQVLTVDYTSVVSGATGTGSSGASTLTTSYGEFVVESADDTQTYVDVFYDYNSDFKTNYASFPSTIEPLCRKITTGQLVFNCTIFEGGTHVEWRRCLGYAIGIGSITFTVVDQCLNYALYYVNKYGGLDTLVCGKCIESWDGSNTDAELYSLRSSMLDTEKVRIKSDITHSYNITTLPLTDAEAGLVDNLIFSPQVFLHDIEANTIRAVVIDTSSVSRKYSRYDKAPYYSLTVKESQYQHRQ